MCPLNEIVWKQENHVNKLHNVNYTLRNVTLCSVKYYLMKCQVLQESLCAVHYCFRTNQFPKLLTF